MAIAFLITPLSFAEAQTIKQQSNLTVDRIEYTDSELSGFGFSEKDLKEYTKRLNSIEGKWWGHLSPMELMMYSAKDESERYRFAKMYLSTHNPKAQAERKSAIAMYSAAREIMTESLTQTFSQAKAKSAIIFVNINCTDCANEVRSFVSSELEKVDIYVTGMSRERDIRNQLITWASALNLPHQKVTLNDDKGIYQRTYGHRLSRIKVVKP